LAREAVEANAAEGGDFESLAAWELLRAGSDGSSRVAAVTALANRAETAGHEAAIRGLYGEGGPSGPGDHAELLEGWEAAGREAPILDYESALACLGEMSFGEAKRIVPLFRILRTGTRVARGDPEYAAWSLLFEAAPERQPFRDWAEAASRLQGLVGIGLSSRREVDLHALAARVAVQSLGEEDHARGLEILLDSMGREWPLDLGDALAHRAAKSINPQKLLARAFVVWQAPKRCRIALLETAMPRATRDLSAKELEAVGASLGERWGPPWEDWLEEHPPRRAVSRAVRGVLRRGEDR
jgi:hypothetical protein